jgi:two-component system, sensor histidine kinase PdtaS
MTTLPSLTHLGLPGIDPVAAGLHACHFYRSQNELVGALVPYFVAGLRGNERCIWITARPLLAVDAAKALRAAWNGVDRAIETGALRTLDFDQWYAGARALKGLDMVQSWLEEEERALADGYNGIRIAGYTSFLEPGDWSTFMEYEEAVTRAFANRRIVALCSYPIQSSDEQMNEVMRVHHCALHRPDVYWHVLPVSRGFSP